MLARRKHWLIALAVLAVAAAACFVAARVFVPRALAAWVSGPEFNGLMSDAVSHALKVDGRFGPMSLGPDFSVATDGFRSEGWPGQAIGSLNASAATGRFDPWGVLRGQWKIDSINVGKVDLLLLEPDDALKARDPVPGPKPWYAFLLPSQFHCGLIECPDMAVELPLGATKVSAKNLQVGATMIGRNFKYTGKGGTLNYPGYPPMGVESFEVYVTREMIDIGHVLLKENSGAGSMEVAGRFGQHSDHSISAKAEVKDIDLAPFLPGEVGSVFSGRLGGRVEYSVGTDGHGASGSGSVAISGGRFHDWAYLDRMAGRAGDPALRSLEFRQMSADYAMTNGVISVTNLVVAGVGAFDLQGAGSWDTERRIGEADLAVSRIPLGAYLPSSLRGVRGELSGSARWRWDGVHLTRGHGGGALRVAGGSIDGFKFQDFLARFLKDDSYRDLAFSEASCRWEQDASGLRLRDIFVLAPGKVGLRGEVKADNAGRLSGSVYVGAPKASLAWLPDATTTLFARQEDGLYWCAVELSGTETEPKTDFTARVLRELEKHPAAAAELVARGLSWWLGDLLHGGREG